mmetsp:Transcript_12965/g.34935  ORF Transcript_12965/g.34935 Transcript_12965/m.34935 type:complete len:199 (+) Transcript_12965:451-1047(+)
MGGEVVSGVATCADVRAWYMDGAEDVDRREPHVRDGDLERSSVSAEQLAALGVLHWSLSGAEDDADLETIRTARGYNYKDVVRVAPDSLPNYEQKLAAFYEEHMHSDEEIRYVVEGSGYFDVRDAEDRWIRIDCQKGDLIILPEGIYHRFTVDTKNYIKAMRLFIGEPVWTPLNRPQEEHGSRIKYTENFIKQGTVAL